MGKKIFPFLIILFCFISCQYDLLPSPSSSGNSSAAQFNNKSILPPDNVVASQGNYRSVTLTWEPVKNATQYQIFSADTEFDTFEKKGETKGTATSFTIQESTGTTKAYYVRSVDYNGNISRPSFITKGSSISVPIITDITKNTDGDIYTINWWMSNCSEETYEDSISYTINCYEEGVNTPAKTEIPGNITSYEFTNLKQSTVYKFTIEAYKTDSKQKHEISDTEPIETGHRIVPDAARNFTVSKGTHTSQIKLSFNLPPAIEASTGDGTYEKENPVYFTLKRRLASNTDDSSLTTIYDYIGYNAGSKYAAAAGKKKILTGSYTENQLIELTDTLTSADRGKKYVYILQSYTDVKGSTINPNLSSSVTSVTQDTGWTISQATFKIESSNTIENSKITSIAVKLHMGFNDLETPYSYFLTSQKYDINSSSTKVGEEVLVAKSNRITDLDNQIISYSSPETEKGYYEYKLYITERTDSSTLPAVIYEALLSPSKITVTDDLSSLPEIRYDSEETFHVTDGYKDKFILSWNAITDCTYILSWQNKNGDGYSETKTIGPFTESSYSEPNDTGTVISNISKQNGKIILTHSAQSGEIRSYTLTAIKGLSNSCEKEEDFFTLGTAAPEMQTPDYDKITIVWNKVQKAKTDIASAYSVSAKYHGESKELLTSSNCEITETEDNKIKCVITKPEGYDDARISGKAIDLSVTTAGEHDNTTATEQVYTLGPANLNVIRDPDLFTDHINISWNRVEGARGYLVYRVIKNNLNQFVKNTDGSYETGNILYVTSTGVYSNGEKINSAKSVASAETVLFTDSYEYTKAEDAELDSLKKHQIKLTWGLPVSYTVIPVLNDSDINFDVTSTGIIAKRKDNSFSYKNLSNVITSTFGYGLNVKASKAASNTAVTITWEQPYNPGNLLPKIYRKKEGSSEWEFIASPSANSSATMSHTITYGANETNSFEYAVVYNNSSLDKTYTEKLESVMDSGSPSELSNKGYTLSLPQGFISADSAGGYKEKFSWEGSTYDFTKRNIGPDYYEIQILNKNKATGWTTIAKIPIETLNNYNCTKAENNTDYQSSTGVKWVSSNSYQAIFEPVFNSDNIAPGQMQVLRDYKHYYRLVAVKMTDSDRKNAITAVADIYNAPDGSKITPYAVREISANEFIRMGLLQYSNAIYTITSGGQWSNAAKNTTTTDNGSWKILKDWGKIYYTITDYNYVQNLPYILPQTNTNATSKMPVSITTTGGTYNKDECVAKIQLNGIDESSFTKTIEEVTIKLTPVNNPDFISTSLKNSYSGTITFSTSSGNDITIKSSKDSNTITASSSATRRFWLPLKMYKDSQWYMWFTDTADTKYYWWDTAPSQQGGN